MISRKNGAAIDGDAATPSVGKLNRRTDLEARFPVYYKTVYKKRPPSVRRLHNAADGGFILIVL